MGDEKGKSSTKKGKYYSFFKRWFENVFKISELF